MFIVVMYKCMYNCNSLHVQCTCTYKVSTQLFGKDKDAGGRVRLLEFVVDGDEGLEVAGRGSTMKVLLLVVQGLGVGTATHGTLTQ